ncbi:DNA primase/polymerase [Gordonia phage Wojtek]|uniref:DNA primase/polymerase n=1 Tax=Gordonia phage Wojtek TaxID=2910758 RepID=A0AA49GYR8_9CAUD|nr:DNA primase/polymerase [Gordonia phage Wojtek]
MAEPARDINSSRPFHNTWEEYVEKGWVPIPLKPRLKNPNDVGTTGRKNPLPKGEDLTAWIKKFADDAPQKANIGLRMDQTIIGIDIDHYGEKTGYNQYEKMVEKFGPLPDTYISTARTDGKSGIRFFRIPSKYVGKLSWSGKASSHIDIIQYVHRFAAVYPSYHPETEGQYAWYDSEWNPIEIPSVADLPELPKEWVKFLTRGFMAWQAKPMDIDSSLTKVQEWYESHTAQGEMCRTMKKYLKTAIDGLDDAAAHDPLVRGHYSILMAAVDDQGHRGSLTAAKEFENAWLDRVKSEDGKRSGLREAKSEIYRSRAGALRLAKGRILGDSRDEDSELLNSIDWTASACRCIDMSEFEVEESTENSSTIALVRRTDADGADDDGAGPADFPKNHKGNAMYMDYLYGENIKWLSDAKLFLHWNNRSWKYDNDGHNLTKAAFDVVRRNQEIYADHLKGIYLELKERLDQARRDELRDGTIKSLEAEAKEARAIWKEWASWALSSGMDNHVNSSINLWKSKDGNHIESNVLNNDPYLLGVANGVVELGKGTVVLRQAKREDYVTLNTNVKYFEGGFDEIKNKGGDLFVGAKLWEQYLDTFIPNLEVRHFVQKLMGYSMLGDNRERLLVFLHGTTSTGKTLIVEATMAAMGEYAAPFPMSIFEDNDEKKPVLLNLRDKRLITSDEISAVAQMDEAVAKRLTGDTASSGRYLNSNKTESFKLKGLPIIATNNAPNMSHADSGFARRLCVVGFDHKIKNEDPGVKEKILTYSKEAVFAWMVEGYINYSKEGLHRNTWPEAVLSATERFMGDLSPFGEFFRDNIITVDYDPTDEDTRRDTSLSLQQIHRAYKNWADKTGEENVMGERLFARKMSGINHVLEQGKYFDNKNTKRYRGLAFSNGEGEVKSVNFKGGTA